MSTPAAIDFFAEVVAETPEGVSSEISADAWAAAFKTALERQLSAYGRIYLPHLGRGIRRHLPERGFKILGRTLKAPRQTHWFFDSQHNLDWLDIAVSYPLEDIDDWMILFRTDDLSVKARDTLRPPLVPRLRKTLQAREWSIVDVCETAEGNLEFTDFLELIDRYPWIKIDHRTDRGTCIIETWGERTRKTLLRIELDYQLQTNVSSDFPPVEMPLLFHPQWTPPEDPRALAAIGDVLDDIYATLRRLIRANFHIDPDRLGPLLFWRDWPDELFEFDEKEDSAYIDPALQMADVLGTAPEKVVPTLSAWLQRALQTPSCELPFLGTLLVTTLPDLEMISYDGTHDEVQIPGGPLVIATPLTEVGNQKSEVRLSSS